MRTIAIVLAALMIGAGILAVAPTVEARPAPCLAGPGCLIQPICLPGQYCCPYGAPCPPPPE